MKFHLFPHGNIQDLFLAQDGTFKTQRLPAPSGLAATHVADHFLKTDYDIIIVAGAEASYLRVAKAMTLRARSLKSTQICILPALDDYHIGRQRVKLKKIWQQSMDTIVFRAFLEDADVKRFLDNMADKSLEKLEEMLANKEIRKNGDVLISLNTFHATNLGRRMAEHAGKDWVTAFSLPHNEKHLIECDVLTTNPLLRIDLLE